MNDALDKESLIVRYLNGQATQEDEAMIFRLSKEDPNFAGDLYQQALLEQDLSDMFQAATVKPAELVTIRRFRWTRFFVPLAAAATLLVSVFGWNAYRAEKAVVGRVVEVRGQTQEIKGGSAAMLKAGDFLRPGDVVKVGSGGYVKYVYVDGSVVELEKDTQLELVADKIWKAKGIRLDAGTLIAQVAKQSYGRPMSLTTPHARILVLGTSFILGVETNNTDLHVVSGKVSMTELSGGQSVMVAAGHGGMVQKGMAPVVSKRVRVESGTRVEWTGPVEKTLHAVPRLVKEGFHYRLRPAAKDRSEVTETLGKIGEGRWTGTFRVTGVTSNEGAMSWIDVETIAAIPAGDKPAGGGEDKKTEGSRRSERKR